MSEEKKPTVKKESREEKIKRLREIYQTAGDSVDFEKEPGFTYRWANTTKDRHLKYQKMGYTQVKDDKGQVYTRNAGFGEQQVLLRIPDSEKELIDQMKKEDAREQLAAVENLDDQGLYVRSNTQTIKPKIHMDNQK